MNFFSFFKRQLITTFIFIFSIEIILQVLFYFDVKFIKQPYLFYNGFCHQNYWNINSKKLKFDERIVYHPILAYKKSEANIPNQFENNIIKNKKKFSKLNVALYGSSFINHKEFKQIIKSIEHIKFENYALNSYGLDQIYLSYKLTSHLNQNQVIVFGFLLEDLDRAIFERRDYNKPKFSFINNNFELTNIPIDQEKIKKTNFDFYLFRFVKNFLELLENGFDTRLSTCDIDLKRNLLNYFFTNIQLEAKKYNQTIIVITFNLKEDLTKTLSWRYDFVKRYLSENNFIHVDALEVLKRNSRKNNEEMESYYAEDLHNSKKSFKYIIKEFLDVYNAI